MRFLADESCNFAVVRALRHAGHDVIAVSEITPRAEDPQVLTLAFQGERILLTEDKDFGQLVFAHGQHSSGVILLRYPPRTGRSMSAEVVRLVKQRGEKLHGSFVVAQPGKVRIVRDPHAF